MKKNEDEIFKEYCHSYANRFIYCMSQYTTEKWLHTMAKFKCWRAQDELQEKYNIKFRTTDIDKYKIYEDIFIEVLSERIEDLKKEASEKERKAAKSKNVRRKVDKS